jgi:hypothetical protein
MQVNSRVMQALESDLTRILTPPIPLATFPGITIPRCKERFVFHPKGITIIQPGVERNELPQVKRQRTRLP